MERETGRENEATRRSQYSGIPVDVSPMPLTKGCPRASARLQCRSHPPFTGYSRLLRCHTPLLLLPVQLAFYALPRPHSRHSHRRGSRPRSRTGASTTWRPERGRARPHPRHSVRKCCSITRLQPATILEPLPHSTRSPTVGFRQRIRQPRQTQLWVRQTSTRLNASRLATARTFPLRPVASISD